MTETDLKCRLTHELRRSFHKLKTSIELPDNPPPVVLTSPKTEEHGDFACNIALVLARSAKRNPRDLAALLVRDLGDAGGLLERAEVAGPGFINLFVSAHAWRRVLSDILKQGPRWIRSNHGQGHRVLLEYVSANPTGPLHVAHGRGAVTGDVLANLLDAAGYRVEREFYVNDQGHQVDVLARSIHLRYRELFGDIIEPPDEFYPGGYIRDIARALRDIEGERYLKVPENDWLEPVRDFGIKRLLERIRADLDAFGVRFDRFTSERELVSRGDLDGLLRELKSRDVVYQQDGKTWFRTTDYGDDKDRVVIREDGRSTYFCSDIAYQRDKAERGFDSLINIWGADHGGYVARVRAGLEALGYAPALLDVVLIQMVSLTRSGEAVRMGKRLGTAVWLRDVVEEVGRDAVRYFFLLRRSDSQFDFDLDLATKKSLDNPVYYAQMGHARLCSIMHRAEEQGYPTPQDGDGALDALALREELRLIKMMACAPEVVVHAATSREPHQVVFYVQELIAEFHSYYTRYGSSERVISNDSTKTRARLLLCSALRTTLGALLGILGVEAPERMEQPEA